MSHAIPPWRAVERGDPEYPVRLAEVDGSPERLWVIGRDLATLPPAVAIVGARRCTPYGREIARGLARDVASSQACVVSGMARGIDSAAHEGALDVRGITVAVLAGGVDVPYPPGALELYGRIAATGSIVSERPPGSPSFPSRFVERNRVIAWLSCAVVVVQAALPKSGALTTARFAHDAHREVLAVPGDLRSILSSGPHELIAAGEAHLCRSADDIIRVLPAEVRRHGVGFDEPPPPALAPDEASVLVAVGNEPASGDTIIARSGLPVQLVLRLLGRLELAGLVGRAPGGTYFRLR